MNMIPVTMLILAGGAVGAVDLSSMSHTVGNAGTTTQDGTFTYVLTLDVATMRSLLEKGQAAAWGTSIVSYNAGGTLTGIVVNGSSTNGTINTSSLYGKWGSNNAWGNFMSYTVQETNPTTGAVETVTKSYDLADLNGAAAGTGWDAVAGAGIVYTFDAARGSKCALTLCDASGASVFSHVCTLSGLKSAAAGAASVSFGDMVTGYYYSDSVLSEADSLSASSLAAVESLALIPEPTTATLSLLALATLALRRRR